MFAILTVLTATAFASVPGSSLEDVVANSRAIVRGEVTSVQTCTNTPQTRAWTFVSFRVDQTLRGQVQTQNNILTVRLPGGPFPNGRRGGVLGIPSLNTGNRAVLALSARSDGTAAFLPFADLGASVLRTVQLGPNKTAVVDGIGRPLHLTGHGPGRGDAQEALTADLAFGQVFNPPAAAQLLAPLNIPPQIQGAPPDGPWAGGLSLQLSGVIGNELLSGRCEGPLTGDVEGGVLTAFGTCNAPLVGATDLDLYGIWDGQGWALTLQATPAAFPNESRTLDTWVPGYRLDAVQAGLDVADVGGEPVETDGALWMTWRGPKPLLDVSQLIPWIQTTSAAHPERAGLVKNTPLNPANCNAVVPVRALD